MPRWIDVGPLLALTGVLALGGCTQTRETPTVAQDETPPKPEPQPAAAPSPTKVPGGAELEAAALACDGATLAGLDRDGFAQLNPEGLAPSATLLVTWESARAFGADGVVERSAVDALADGVAAELDVAPPKWWVEQLASAKRIDGSGPPFYDVGRTPDGDRRGAWLEGPGGLKVRSTAQLTEQDEQLAYDFSMGRATLGPIPKEPGFALEHTRAHAGSTVYFAMFPVASGGFPFPVHAVTSSSEKKWTAEVCGPKRRTLGGLGHLTVEFVVLEDPPKGGLKMTARDPPKGLAVFTAETHGVALEVFDIDSGKRTLAWSSDLWFMRT